MTSKHFLKSKGVIAGLLSLLSCIILFFVGRTPNTKYFAISTALTTIVSIYGRLVAKERLYIRKKKSKP